MPSILLHIHEMDGYYQLLPSGNILRAKVQFNSHYPYV